MHIEMKAFLGKNDIGRNKRIQAFYSSKALEKRNTYKTSVNIHTQAEWGFVTPLSLKTAIPERPITL